jgi:hypothetical protein
MVVGGFQTRPAVNEEVLLYNYLKSGARTSIICVSGVDVRIAPRIAANTKSQRFDTLICTYTF